MTEWYHGTDQRFDRWVFPPPPSPTKPELLVHSAVFLTTDIMWATIGVPNLCKARIQEAARVIDVRSQNPESDALRRRLLSKRYGRTHDCVTSAEWWQTGWKTGEAMRPVYSQGQFANIITRVHHAQAQLAQGVLTPRIAAIMREAQNLTRAWIEEIAVTAREMGFDVLIGREVNSKHPAASTAPDVLFALTENALTGPEWLTGGPRR